MVTFRAQRQDRDDLVVHETVVGLVRDPALALYVVSLYGVRHPSGETINGDAMLVRPRGASDFELLAAILGCLPKDVAGIIARSGSWSIREVAEIDGHRIRIEAD